jgi:hypothetical protein
MNEIFTIQAADRRRPRPVGPRGVGGTCGDGAHPMQGIERVAHGDDEWRYGDAIVAR